MRLLSRSTPVRRRLAAGALLIALAGGTSTAAALPSGPESEAPAPSTVDTYSTYVPQKTCDPSAKPGAQALLRLAMDHYKVGRNTGITRSCSIGGTSEHKEGRAFDWGLSVDRPAEKAAGDAFTTWLTAVGPDGKPGYNARRLGVMYIIWNRQIWAAYDTKTGWRAYYGASPHTDHVHVSLSWDGAYQRTSWWDTRASDLVRTVANPTVYVLSGSKKHPVPNADLFAALGPLGPVSFVSQSYLDSRTAGAPMRRMVLAPNGSISFVDAGIRLPMGSCAQVADFGQSCADVTRLEAAQVAKLHAGPPMTNLYRTTSGKAFYVSGGARREVADTTALVQSGLPTASVTLLESGIANLPYGTPVVADGQVVRSRTSGTTVLSAGGQHTPLTHGMESTAGIASLPTAVLDEASLARLPQTPALAPIVREATGSRVYLLTTAGKVHLTSLALIPPTLTTATSGALARIPDAGSTGGSVFVKAQDNATVFYLQGGQRRPIGSWSDLVTLNGGSPAPTIRTLPGGSAAMLSSGPTQVPPGTLVKAPDDGTVYLTNGLGSRITVGSFTVTNELGAAGLRVLPAADLAAYSVTPGTLTRAVTCGGQRYAGLSGQLHPVTESVAAAYGLAFTTLDPATCAALPRSPQPLGRFLRTPDGTIYHVADGTKRPIAAWNAYVTLGGTPANTLSVTHATAALVSTAR